MSRHELAWVVTRAFGLYLLLRALLELPSISLGLYRAFNAVDGFGDRTIETVQQQWKLYAMQSIATVVLYAAAGLYLLFKGQMVFRWLSRMGCTDDAAA